MSNYIKVLNSIDSKIKKDEKFISKIFGTKDGYAMFIRSNVEWILDK